MPGKWRRKWKIIFKSKFGGSLVQPDGLHMSVSQFMFTWEISITLMWRFVQCFCEQSNVIHMTCTHTVRVIMDAQVTELQGPFIP